MENCFASKRSEKMENPQNRLWSITESLKNNMARMTKGHLS